MSVKESKDSLEQTWEELCPNFIETNLLKLEGKEEQLWTKAHRADIDATAVPTTRRHSWDSALTRTSLAH
jgi:hypothetical protein